MIKSSSAASLGKQSAGGGGSSAARSTSKSETVNYLLLYEAMVRNQDLEFEATRNHVALTVERIRRLGRRGGGDRNNAAASPDLVDEDEATPPGMLTYREMRRCLLRLGYTWNRSLPPPPPPSSSSSVVSGGGRAGTGGSEYGYDDDVVSVLSAGSASTFVSGGGSNASSSAMAAARDIIATDAQLIMLLTTLVEMEERHRAARLAKMEDDDEESEGDGIDGVLSRGLFIPEFIQAYKAVIGGMQSLQAFPSDPAQDADRSLQEAVTRARERTLGLLRLFGPDSGLYKDTPALGVDPAGQQSAGEEPTSRLKKSSRDGLKSTPTRSRRGKGGGRSSTPTRPRRQPMVAKDGLLPRLTEEEIRKTVQAKDAALARILEEHETEMNAMANDMEVLRQRSVRSQEMAKKRRRRAKIAVLFGGLLLACGGAWHEFRRREQVRLEIASGREAERLADQRTIAGLRADLKALKSKLDDAEAAIRYEESRHAEASKRYEAAVRVLKEKEGLWEEAHLELERCTASVKDLDANLTSVKLRNAGVEEEVEWCRERLVSAERAMEGVERALEKSRENKADAKVPSLAEIAKEIEVQQKEEGSADTTVDGKRKGGGKHRPVKMEMKYNKSFRNAVILRQAYSAIAGMVASMVANMIFPGLGQAIQFLK